MRFYGVLLVVVATLGVAACANIGSVLATRTIDVPLGEGGTLAVESEGIAVHSAPVRIDSVPLPERLWFAQEMEIDEDEVSLRGAQGGSGVVDCGLLIDGYPAALWSVAVEGGTVKRVSPSTMPVPGQSRSGGQAGRKPIPFQQLGKLRAVFSDLPAQRRPELAENLSFSLVGDDPISDAEWGKVFRGINSGIESRAFDVTFVVATDHPIEGTLAIETLELTVRDSGQRLMGGTETASD